MYLHRQYKKCRKTNTGTDRVLAFGFHKNIEVYFCDIILPTVSNACGLILNYHKGDAGEHEEENSLCLVVWW